MKIYFLGILNIPVRESEMRCFLGLPNFGQHRTGVWFLTPKLVLAQKLSKVQIKRKFLQFSLPFQTSIIHRFKCQNISNIRKVRGILL